MPKLEEKLSFVLSSRVEPQVLLCLEQGLALELARLVDQHGGKAA